MTAGSASSDSYPLIFSRVSPTPATVDDWLAWEVGTHMRELVAAPGLEVATLYEAVRDSVPEVYRPACTHAVIYRAEDANGLEAYAESEEFKAAIGGAVKRRTQLDPVDFAPFTTTLCEVEAVHGQTDGSSAILVQRYEVGDERADEFDRWFEHEHIAALTSVPGVTGVRSLRAIRTDLAARFAKRAQVGPTRFSPGNRIAIASLSGVTSPAAVATSGPMIDVMRGAVAWDVILPYVSRELFSQVVSLP
jgi:hypothetical protein